MSHQDPDGNEVFVAEGCGDVDFGRIDSSLMHRLGLQVKDNFGGVWQYCKAATTLTAYRAHVLLVDGLIGSATAADDELDDDAAGFTGGRPVGFPQQAFATVNTYGWIQRSSGSGTMYAYVAANLSDGAKLYTSATAGALDDTAAAHYNVVGDCFAAEAASAAPENIKVQILEAAKVETVVADAAA